MSKIEIGIEPAVVAKIISAASRGDGLRLEVTVVAGGDQRTAAQPVAAGPPRGPLAPLMMAGVLRPNDRLVWHRPRRQARHVATVLANGQLELDGSRYDSPSGAASAASGNAVDGWLVWRRDSDGMPLSELRRRAGDSRRVGDGLSGTVGS